MVQDLISMDYRYICIYLYMYVYVCVRVDISTSNPESLICPPHPQRQLLL